MLLTNAIADRSFTPEQIAAMTTAFDAACRDLGLLTRDDPIVRMVAKAIVDVASAGDFDPEEIRSRVLKRLSFFDAENAAMTALLGDAIALTGADLGNIQRYDPADKSLAIVVQHGFNQDFLRTFERVSLDDTSACARAMRAKMPILIPDVSLDDDFRDYRGIARNAGFASVLSVPLITGSAEFIGVLSVHFGRTRSPKDVRMDVVSDYARNAADGLAGTFSQRAIHAPRS
jgi:GAF domain-containing protein